MKIAPNRTRRRICSFDRLRGISKQIYLALYNFLYKLMSNVVGGGRLCPPVTNKIVEFKIIRKG